MGAASGDRPDETHWHFEDRVIADVRNLRGLSSQSSLDCISTQEAAE
jgi:hypothetical protein